MKKRFKTMRKNTLLIVITAVLLHVILVSCDKNDDTIISNTPVLSTDKENYDSEGTLLEQGTETNIGDPDLKTTCIVPGSNSLLFNWEIQQEDISHKTKTTWENELSAIHNYFVSFFDYEDTQLIVDVVYFTDMYSFEEYQTTVLNRTSPSNTGFYSLSTGKMYMINENNSSSIAKNIFLHEGTHKIFNTEIIGGAIILNEGLATVFQTIHKKGGDYLVSVNDKYETIINQMLNSNTIYDLNTFFNLTNQEWQLNASKTYAQSNSLMYYLLSMYPQQLQLLINEYKNPVNQRQNYIDFFNANYTGGVTQLETDWRNWISNSHKPEVKL